MRDVVEHETRDGNGSFRSANPVVRGGMCLSKSRIIGVKCKRDEGLKSTGFILKLSKFHQVIDAVLFGLEVAVEHRAVRRNAE